MQKSKKRKKNKLLQSISFASIVSSNIRQGGPSMDTYKNKVRVAAHRGNSKYYPENTILGFKEALKLNVDQLEIDLHMTKDGEIIMMHDHECNYRNRLRPNGQRHERTRKT